MEKNIKNRIARDFFEKKTIYSIMKCSLNYGDKRACNKRIGPGGGTRRLHQKILGAEIGSTDV